MNTQKPKNPKSAACIVLLLATSASLSHGAALANFTDGDGTTSVDQYTGIAGAGWDTGWARTTNNGTLSGTVINTSPLNGGGNYLSSTLTSSAIDGRGANSRDYTAFATPYTTSFSYRLDSWTSGGVNSMTGATDYIDLYDFSGTPQSSFSGSGTWSIRAFGAATGSLAANEWGFYNNPSVGAAYSATNYVASGMTMVPGTVYTFSIYFDPAAKLWSATISNGLTSVSSSVPLATRANTTTPTGNIHFGASASNTNETIVYSVDGVNITAVPEPTIAALAGLGLLGFVARRRRH